MRLQGPRPSAHTASYAHLFEGFAELVASGAEYGRTRGVAIAVELHHHTIIPSVGLALPLVRRFPPGEVGVIYDVGNLVHEGYENHRIALELLGPYLRHVHLKNVQAFGSPDGHWGYRWGAPRQRAGQRARGARLAGGSRIPGMGLHRGPQLARRPPGHPLQRRRTRQAERSRLADRTP